jgi:6-phosphogluconolactonase
MVLIILQNHNMNRRKFLTNISLTSISLMTSQSILQKLVPGMTLNRQDFYVGNYGTGQEGGIYFCRLQLITGEMIIRGNISGIDNPSFLSMDASNQYLIAVNEVSEINGNPGGSVSSFKIDPENGSLTFINMQSTLGESPCHITIDRTGKFILIANYSGGNIIVFPILQDCMIGKNVEFIQHKGKSIIPDRQENPHPHSIILSPDNRYAFVPDLGLDKILIYRFDQKTGKLRSSDIPYISLKPGAGPRHFTFNRDGKFAYVINELDSTVTAFRYYPEKGKLKEIQTITTLPGDFTGISYCADIHIHPNNHFLYGSNRGHNSISTFSIDPSKGKLKLKGFTETLGDFPRNFAIDPSGQYLLAANQRSDNIFSFRIKPETGELTPTGYKIEIPKPVCIKFLN